MREEIKGLLTMLATLLPAPEGPALAAAVRGIDALLGMGKDPEAELKEIVAKYSEAAQKLADGW